MARFLHIKQLAEGHNERQWSLVTRLQGLSKGNLRFRPLKHSNDTIVNIFVVCMLVHVMHVAEVVGTKC